MLLFHEEVGQCLIGRRATIRERILVVLRAGRLDRALAGGASPEATALLALRAQALVRPAMRQDLALALQRIVDDSIEPVARYGQIGLELRNDGIRDARDELEYLIDRLLAPVPVSAAGVARALLLVSDGAGPLYGPVPAQELRAHVQAAVLALEPVSPW